MFRRSGDRFAAKNMRQDALAVAPAPLGILIRG
jgi:hypothetical protein